MNGSLTSLFSSSLSNEFRFQWAREDRPRPYDGPDQPGHRAAVPRHRHRLRRARRLLGLPDRHAVLHPGGRATTTGSRCWTTSRSCSGNHLFKVGGEWNRTGVNQTFRGFGNGRMAFTSVNGFLNYVANGNGYVECADDVTNTPTPSQTTGACPAGEHITGPVALYLQQAGVGGLTVDEAGTQTIIQNELALFLQDSWKPRSNLTLNYGLRWEAQIQPEPDHPDRRAVLRAVHRADGHQRRSAPSSSPATAPSRRDYSMFQPRLGHRLRREGRRQAGRPGQRRPLLRPHPGPQPGQQPEHRRLAGTDALPQQRADRRSWARRPAYGELLPVAGRRPVPARACSCSTRTSRTRGPSPPRVGYEREIGAGARGRAQLHPRPDRSPDPLLQRQRPGVRRARGPPGSARRHQRHRHADRGAEHRQVPLQRHHRRAAADRRRPQLQFQVNYTLSWDKSDDDNERDPFTFRYARADSLETRVQLQRPRPAPPVQRLGAGHPAGRLLPQQPAERLLGAARLGELRRRQPAAPARAWPSQPAQRICPDGHVLQRNTIRRDNAFFSWDIRLSRPFNFGRQGTFEAIFEVFNVTNADNFKDPSSGGTFLNFDGTIRSGLGEPRQFQVGGRWLF